VDLTIYRCIQESLTNAIRHAQATHIDVQIYDNDAPGLLKLIVRDDGRGMAVGASSGLGIRGMQERVEGLGGRYFFQSETGRGTCVNITIPLGYSETGCQRDSRIIAKTP
jgi:two-component system sensor histidine kinase UhpB